MEKDTILRDIREKLINQSLYRKFFIFYNDEYESIITLKKELRLLTKKYSDFHKRNNGFYNSYIDIFLSKETMYTDKYNDIIFFVNNETDAIIIKEVILKFLETFYDRKTYYRIMDSSIKGYYIQEESLNFYEYQKMCKDLKILLGERFGIFSTKEEAYNKILETIDKKIINKEKELENLKEMKRNFLEEYKEDN